MSKDLLLDDNHDLVIENFDLTLTLPDELTGQKIKQALLLFRGEWFLNNSVGLPYFEDILGKNKSLSRIETIFIRAIQSIPEVTSIESFTINFDNETRKVKVDFEVRDNQNNLISITL